MPTLFISKYEQKVHGLLEHAVHTSYQRTADHARSVILDHILGPLDQERIQTTRAIGSLALHPCARIRSANTEMPRSLNVSKPRLAAGTRGGI